MQKEDNIRKELEAEERKNEAEKEWLEKVVHGRKC
jgi:hypothetical protein